MEEGKNRRAVNNRYILDIKLNEQKGEGQNYP